ncbi:MAG: copper resistance protein CopD [Nitrosopumilaceae archaeon]|nr:copper resistance protein CopD [Nitrosopumilaceae archaeon]NIT99902.1 copper resistance protein CopD [Nitrosopumilaceae archaeon]NIU86256.1 copper resistance protein CopD [Nitrosopumilaceae archaeon]NIV65011.1 copper resistance protein CopD [Nitrosopumilaceae archaeon]NIX60505.1 copper resistance protein CopD [Nitrosopumilaceae archaeon]
MRKLLVVFIIISMTISSAYGHPFTEETIPESSSNVESGLTEIIVHYSEPVEIDHSVLKVLDSNGNQIDNKDTKYFEEKEEDSLIVTTPPLEDGVYTVTSKVLSQVDGHLVDDAFIFAVGEAAIDPSQLEQQKKSETVFLPEAGSRFPGFVGQTILLGIVFASILIWGTQNKNLIKEEFEKFERTYFNKFTKIIGIGIVLVVISNILMLVVQMIRLEASPIDALQTNFGTTWIIRTIIIGVLAGYWFFLKKSRVISLKNQIPIIVLSLVLLVTSTMIGHGTASGDTPAIIFDYIHNIVASIWIGGIMYFVFTLLPSFSNLENSKKESMALVMIPRFSIVFVIAVGIVIISGPLLMWFLESNVSLIISSSYGKLILAKIGIAAGMVALGAYFQLYIQKKGEISFRSGSFPIYKKLRKSLKIDAALGIALLGVVALLTNSSLPAGEVQQVQAQEIAYGFNTNSFSQNLQFKTNIFPFTSGTNTIEVVVTDLNNKPVKDLDSLKVKVSNPQRNISPIVIQMNQVETEDMTKYQGDVTFGFSGTWQLEIEALRTQNANESVILDLLVKPRLTDLKKELVEYEFPKDGKPLYPVYDGEGGIWISDPSNPRIWKFTIEDKKFEMFNFDGKASSTLAKDNEGKIWFIDIPERQIGFVNPENNEITTINLSVDGIAVSLQADFDDNIWITITDKNLILKYNQKSQEFKEFEMKTEQSGPFALTRDLSGKIWFSQSNAGQIGYIDPDTEELKEIIPEQDIESPEAMIFDKEGNLWVTAHTGTAIVKFNPVLETFKRIDVPDSEALPFGMTFDRYDNIWFAQHTIDKLGVYDPHNKDLIEMKIPSEGSFVQFATSDGDNNVWIVEQQTNKLGMVKLTELSSNVKPQEESFVDNIQYAEVASPLIAAGIILFSLFFVRNIEDKRRLNSLIFS